MVEAAAGQGHISWWFVGAGAVSLTTSALHVLGGTGEILAPLLASNLPTAVKSVFDVMWHQITALLLVGGCAALIAAVRPAWRLPVAVLIGGHYAIITILFLALGAIWFSSPWPMPQWVFFGAVSVLLVIGSRRAAT
jgi:hypothetical protein